MGPLSNESFWDLTPGEIEISIPVTYSKVGATSRTDALRRARVRTVLARSSVTKVP